MQASIVRSASRSGVVSAIQNGNGGFRLARTLPLDGFIALRVTREEGRK